MELLCVSLTGDSVDRVTATHHWLSMYVVFMWCADWPSGWCCVAHEHSCLLHGQSACPSWQPSRLSAHGPCLSCVHASQSLTGENSTWAPIYYQTRPQLDDMLAEVADGFAEDDDGGDDLRPAIAETAEVVAFLTAYEVRCFADQSSCARMYINSSYAEHDERFDELMDAMLDEAQHDRSSSPSVTVLMELCGELTGRRSASRGKSCSDSRYTTLCVAQLR